MFSDDCLHLKPGLRHRQEFEMVPELLWKFFLKNYRNVGPIICRRVTYRPKLNKPELDLYPVRSTINVESIHFHFTFLLSFSVVNQNLSKSKFVTSTNAIDR